MINLKNLKKYFKKKGFLYRDKLASGGFGSVYIVSINNRDYACKIQYSDQESKLVKMKNECLLSKSLNGKHIVKTNSIHYDTLDENGIKIYSIIMEKALYSDIKFFMNYLISGNLIRIINNTINFNWLYYMNNNTLVFFLIQIFDGLKMLYESNIVHRDIKPENILVAYGFIVKLCDFGISCKGNNNFKLGSSTWCNEGPEYYESKNIEKYEDCFKIDYYPIGLFIYNCLFREHVIDRKYKNILTKDILIHCLNKANEEMKKHELDENEEIKNFEDGKVINKENIKFIDKGLSELTRKLISPNISDRPNILEILENNTLNETRKRIKKISEINQFLEIKLFTELRKPKIKLKNRKKYNILFF